MRGAANLHGTLTWQFEWPADNSYSSSGQITIAAAPEPASYGIMAAMSLLGFVLVTGPRFPKSAG